MSSTHVMSRLAEHIDSVVARTRAFYEKARIEGLKMLAKHNVEKGMLACTRHAETAGGGREEGTARAPRVPAEAALALRSPQGPARKRAPRRRGGDTVHRERDACAGAAVAQGHRAHAVRHDRLKRRGPHHCAGMYSSTSAFVMTWRGR